MELFWVLLIALVAFSVSYWLGEKLEARRQDSGGQPAAGDESRLLERCLYMARDHLSGRVPEEKLPQESVSLAVMMLELLGKSPTPQELALLEQLAQRRE